MSQGVPPEDRAVSEVPVRVWRVGRNPEAHYLLILRDGSGALLPMTIGPCEALAIWAMLHPGREAPGARQSRTHDLLCSLIERLGGRLVKVVIDDLWNQVYYAKLHLAVDGKMLTVDARPSDSVAIALRLGAPLFASPSVLDATHLGGESAAAREPAEEDSDQGLSETE